MKTILLVRHAKTEADSKSGKDFDRKLTDKGHEEATTAAQRLVDRKVEIDALVSSTAVRALETASHFHKAFKSAAMQEEADLYNSTPSAYYKAIKELDKDWKRVAFFGHNPGITNMANDLGVAHTDNLPTAGVFAVSAEVSDWADFKDAEKRFLFFEDPNVKPQ
jgi:phosphohistidine phosphatase